MPKAILELEMPESCRECMFKECLNRTTSVEVSRCIILHKMHVPGSYCPAEGRQADCPLKLVERCEWILIDDDKGLWQCSKCGAEWVLEAGTPADNEMNYCPACGGNQYTACSTAEGCIYCGHKELRKMETLEPEAEEE